MGKKRKKENGKREKRRFSLRYLLGGLVSILFALVIVFSPHTWLFGLAYVLVFPFGWIGMYFIALYGIFLGLTLIFHRHWRGRHLFIVLPSILLLLGVMMLGSYYGNGEVASLSRIGQYADNFQTIATTNLGADLGREPSLSGGILGYLLDAVILENVGMWLVLFVAISAIVVGALILSMPLIIRLSKAISGSVKSRQHAKQKQREHELKEAALSEMVQEREKEMTPFIAPEDIDNSFFEGKEESAVWSGNPLDKFSFSPAGSNPVPTSGDIARARSRPSSYPESDYAPKEIKGGSINMSTPLTPIGLQEAFFMPNDDEEQAANRPLEAETLPSSPAEAARPSTSHPVHPVEERDHAFAERPVDHFYSGTLSEPGLGPVSPRLSEPTFDDLEEEAPFRSDEPAPSPAPSPAPAPEPAPTEEKSEETLSYFYQSITAPLPKEEERAPTPTKFVDHDVAEEEPEPEPEPEPFEEIEEEPEPVQPAIGRTRTSFIAPEPEPVAPEPEPEEEESEPAYDPLVQPKAKPRGEYTFPSTDLLKVYEDTVDSARIEHVCCLRAAAIDKKFADLGIGAHVSGYTVGPSVTRFDIETEPNVSVTSITRFMKDISKAMGGVSTRFTEIVPGKTTSAIEVVNEEEDRRLIPFSDCLAGLPNGPKYNLAIPFGVDIENKVVWGDLSKFPHMLVAGTTGSGKSIFIQGILMSLVMRNRPEDVKLMLVDPKRVEFSKYRDIPHLLCRIIKEAKEARIALAKLCDEMDRRYTLFENAGVSEIREFNSDYCEPNGLEKLPFIVLVVDEFADLVEQEKDVNSSVMRLSAKARACGIHLIICTQRPDVKVINGTIKNNLGTRVALHLKTATDSITILNQAGAEELLDHGDMLVDCDKISREFLRVQGCMVHNHEITKVTNHVREQMPVSYSPIFNDFTDPAEKEKAASAESSSLGSPAGVNLREDSFEVVYAYVRDEIMKMDSTSISKIQRQFRVGYPRASDIMNKLVEDGIVAPKTDAPNSSKPSEVLIHSLEELNGETPAPKGPGSLSSSYTTPSDPYDD